MLLEDGVDQRVLRREAPVERSHPDSCPAGDLLDAGIEPELGERRPGGDEDPVEVLPRVAPERLAIGRRISGACDPLMIGWAGCKHKAHLEPRLGYLAPRARSGSPVRCRRGVRDAAVARRAGAPVAAAGSRHDADGRHVDLHGVPARGLRRDADRRARSATCSARSACSCWCSSVSPPERCSPRSRPRCR